MPNFSVGQRLEKIYLPSMKDRQDENERGWVVMDVSPQKAADMQGFTGSMTIFDMGVSMLCGRIREWNNTDANGELLPINPSNVGQMRTEDFDYLRSKVEAENPELTNDEKKDSASISQKSEVEKESQ